MAFSITKHCLLVIFLYLILSPESSVWAQDMCSKFNIGGPCLLIDTAPITTLAPALQHDDPYCQLACAEQNSDMATYCKCGGVVTTTTEPPTTTPEPETCWYSTQRPERLSGVVKRLFDPTPISTECDYPGVIGLFHLVGGALIPACTGSLVSEDTIIINEKTCTDLSKTKVLYAMPDTYQVSGLTTNYPTIVGSATRLDPTGGNGHLFLLKLQSPLTFDTACVQPACFINDNIPAADIDYNDCRIVGYGETSDVEGSFSTQLVEVLVRVDPTSISRNFFTITRVDGAANVVCFNDDSAPLICSHSITKEWITIGITQTVGYFCSTGGVVIPKVRNIMNEARLNVFYQGLQNLIYQNPLTFPL